MYAVESAEFLLGQPCRMKEAFEAVICGGWHGRCLQRNADFCAPPGTALCAGRDSGMRNGS